MEVNSASNARHAIQNLLDGNAPNGIAPADCGAWADTVQALFDAHAAGGSGAARKAWDAIARTQPGAAQLVAGDGTAQAWGPILPFVQADLPPFPLDIFPTWLQEFCAAVTETMQTPTDLAGMLALSILSTACGGRIGVRAWDGWDEPTNVYTVTSLPPASRKSPVFRAMMAPLIKFEKDQTEKSEKDVEEAEARRDVLKHQLEDAKRKAGKVQGEHATRMAFSDVDGLIGELKDLETPKRFKMIVDDITPEAVSSVLADQGGRVSVLSSEGDIFAIMAGRYSSGAPNIGVYLKGHAGETVRVDRKTRSEHIPNAAITIGITTQPAVMRSFGSNNAFRGQGLLARFFFALPKSTVGNRRTTTEPIPDQVRATYFHRMLMLLENTYSVHSVHSVQDATADQDNSVHSVIDQYKGIFSNISYLEISTPGQERIKAFMDWLEPQLGEYGAMSHFADWAGKLAGAVLRVAGLLHMAETLGQNGQNGQISDNEVARAIRLARYLLPHAQAAYAEIGADPAIDAAKTILRWIEKAAPSSFSKRDCYRGVRGPLFTSADQCDAPLRLLADHGYIREMDTTERAGPGRKASTNYEVNPAILGQNGQNGQNARAQEVGASYAPADDSNDAAYESPTFRAMEGY